MLHFDRQGDLKRRFLITAVQRNRNTQLRLRALQEIAAARDADAFDEAVDIIGTWSRDEKREGVKVMLQALAEKRIGRRDQANAWIWRMAEYTREVHEEYAVQRWPETKRLLGLLVNSSGAAHARNARRIVHAARKQDRRLSAALLAASLAHTPEAQQALDGARTRMARKPSALARELLRNFPKKGRGRGQRRRRKGGKGAGEAKAAQSKAAKSTRAAKAAEAKAAEEEVEEVEEVQEVEAADVVAEINGAADALAAARAVEGDPGPAEEVLDEALESAASTNGPVAATDEEAELEDTERVEIEGAVSEALELEQDEAR
jgi:hypothetical protein